MYRYPFRDPIYGILEFDNSCQEIMDTPEFQRLRHIKQLGNCHFIFPSATHTRFSHSLGTSYLTKYVLDQIINSNPTKLDEKNKKNITIAGLCHDIGHGPFSHLFDSLFAKTYEEEHEARSINILEKMYNEERVSFDGEDFEQIRECIDPKYFKNHWFYKIVSNKESGLDTDKLDYLMRDSYQLGMGFQHPFNAFYKNCKIKDGELYLDYNDMFLYQDIFHLRYKLHHSVYQHPKVKGFDFLIRDIMFEANKKYNFHENINDIDEFLKWDDTLIQEINRSNDPILKDSKELIKRMYNHKPYKLIYQGNFSEWQYEKTKSVCNEYLLENNYIIDLCYLNYWKNEKNPLDNINFYKYDYNKRFIFLENAVKNYIEPTSFQQKEIRIYIKNDKDVPVDNILQKIN